MIKIIREEPSKYISVENIQEDIINLARKKGLIVNESHSLL